MPAEGEPSEARAIIVGDAGYLSDPLVAQLRANAVFALDSFKWLTHDEEITGAVETEEDVEIRFTGTEDTLWFLAAVVTMPSLILLVGLIVIRSRGRK